MMVVETMFKCIVNTMSHSFTNMSHISCLKIDLYIDGNPSICQRYSVSIVLGHSEFDVIFEREYLQFHTSSGSEDWQYWRTFSKSRRNWKRGSKLAHIGNSSWLPFDLKQPNLDVFHIETSSEPSKDFFNFGDRCSQCTAFLYYPLEDIQCVDK